MSTVIKLEGNSLSGIPSDVMGFHITHMRAEAYTLGPTADDHGNPTKSKNHWALVFQGQSEAIRLSMETRLNAITGVMGSLVLKRLSYFGPSHFSVHHQIYTWQDDSATLSDVLRVIISTKFHHFEMVPDYNGAFKGCRHWVQRMLEIFYERPHFIAKTADSGLHHDEYLHYVYSLDQEGSSIQAYDSQIIKGRWIDSKCEKTRG